MNKFKPEFSIEQIRAFVKKDYPSVSARYVKAALIHLDQTPELPLNTGEQDLKEWAEKFMQENPYPEDIFLPVSPQDLFNIHSLLIKELGMPIDRLTGHIGRILRNGIKNSLPKNQVK